MSFIMPTRKNRVELLQTSGELWPDDEPDETWRVGVVTSADSDGVVSALLAAAAAVRPNDVELVIVDVAGAGLGPDIVETILDVDAVLAVVAVIGTRGAGAVSQALREAGRPDEIDALSTLPFASIVAGTDDDAVDRVRESLRTIAEDADAVVVGAAPPIGVAIVDPATVAEGLPVALRQHIGSTLMALRAAMSAPRADPEG